MNESWLQTVWPAMSDSQTLWLFLSLGLCIAIFQTVIIRYFLKLSWLKSFLVFLVGNCLAGLVGTLIMICVYILLHDLGSKLFLHVSLGNLLGFQIPLFLGSTIIETVTVALLFKEKIRKLLLPMLIGIFLIYAFILFVVAIDDLKNYEDVEILKYMPVKQQFTLLDGSKLQLDTATLTIYLNRRDTLKDKKIYEMEMPFHTQNEYNFRLQVSEAGDPSYYDFGEAKHFNNGIFTYDFTAFRDTYKLKLGQDGPYDSINRGTEIIEKDTLIFKRVGPSQKTKRYTNHS